MPVGLRREYVDNRIECRVDLRVPLSVCIAAAVALDFVLYGEFYTPGCRSFIAQLLAVNPHEPTGLTARPHNELVVGDGRDMVLLEKHGHSKDGGVVRARSEWGASEVD